MYWIFTLLFAIIVKYFSKNLLDPYTKVLVTIYLLRPPQKLRNWVQY